MLLAEDLIAGASKEIVEGFDDLDLTIDLIVLMHGILCQQQPLELGPIDCSCRNVAERNDCLLGIIGRHVHVSPSSALRPRRRRATMSKGRPTSWRLGFTRGCRQ